MPNASPPPSLLFHTQIYFALLNVISSKVNPSIQSALNLTDTLSVTFHNAINIYNHRRHPHTAQTTSAPYRIPYGLAHLSGISWTSLNVSSFFHFPSHSLTVFYVVCFHSRMNAWPTMIHMATASSIPRRTAAALALPSRCFKCSGPIRISHRKP